MSCRTKLCLHTVLFQWLTRWCCPVTAEAVGSSPVVPAIFSNSCKTHRSLSCTNPTCAAKTRNIHQQLRTVEAHLQRLHRKLTRWHAQLGGGCGYIRIARRKTRSCRSRVQCSV